MRKRRALALVVAVSSVVFGVSVLTPSPASAVPAPCPEVTDSIERLYAAYFLRQSDASGLDFWIADYVNGNRNLAAISDWFAQSPEFISRYGSLDNAQFVRQVYRNVLGREADGAGLASYTPALAAGTMRRADLLRSIIASAEFRARHPLLSPTATIAAE